MTYVSKDRLKDYASFMMTYNLSKLWAYYFVYSHSLFCAAVSKEHPKDSLSKFVNSHWAYNLLKIVDEIVNLFFVHNLKMFFIILSLLLCHITV